MVDHRTRVPAASRMGQGIIDARHEAQVRHEQKRAEGEALLEYIARVLDIRGFDHLTQHVSEGAGMGDSWSAKEISHMFKVDGTSVAIGVQVADGGVIRSFLMSRRTNGGYEKAGQVATYDDLVTLIAAHVTLEE